MANSSWISDRLPVQRRGSAKQSSHSQLQGGFKPWSPDESPLAVIYHGMVWMEWAVSLLMSWFPCCMAASFITVWICKEEHSIHSVLFSIWNWVAPWASPTYIKHFKISFIKSPFRKPRPEVKNRLCVMMMMTMIGSKRAFPLHS